MSATGSRCAASRAEEIAKSVAQALALVRLGQKGERRISQLSGGERQRVALARALVTRPAILLLDEPLGALDEKLRIEMQSELVEIQRSLGVTFVYITHSQEEALTMSDRVVLLRSGRIEQSGAPVDLFDRPVSRFAAEFMGFENLLPGIVREAHADGRLVVAIGDVADPRFLADACGAAERRRGARRRARRAAGAGRRRSDQGRLNVVPCKPAKQLYRGKYIDQTADTPIGLIKLRNWDRAASSDRFDAVAWRAEDCVVLPR